MITAPVWSQSTRCYLNDNLYVELLETELKLLIFFLQLAEDNVN